MSYEAQTEQLGRWIDENMPEAVIAPPVERAIDIMQRQQRDIRDLQMRLGCVKKTIADLIIAIEH